MALFMKCSLNTKKKIFIPFRANSFTTVLTLTTGKSLFLCLSGHLFSVTFSSNCIVNEYTILFLILVLVLLCFNQPFTRLVLNNVTEAALLFQVLEIACFLI